MSLSTFARKSQRVISDNSPSILTGAAIAGTIITTLLVGRAGYRAGYSEGLDVASDKTPLTETDMERYKRIGRKTWKLYIAPTVTCVGTVTAIATANKIGANRTAALAAAYTVTDKAFTEYKSKVVETLGEKKEQTEIRDKIMQDRVNDAGDKTGIMIVGNDDQLCYDAYSDRYFKSNIEKLKKAQNDTNYEILHNVYVSLSEFYSKIGLPNTLFSDEVGWNSDNLLELHFTSCMTPDDRTALAFNFHVDPVRRYNKVHG